MISTTDPILITYKSFMSIPIAIFKSVGIDLLKLQGPTSFWINLNFWIGFINLTAIILAEFIFLYKTIGQFSSFLEATAIAPCIGVCVMADFKLYTIRCNAKRIDNIQETMKSLFPKTWEEQNRTDVRSYKTHTTRVMVFFLITCVLIIWLFNMQPLARSIFGIFFLNEEFSVRLPYSTWYPFTIETTRAYILTYFHQMFAGFTAIIFSIGVDILLCTDVMQLVMYFDRIAADLREFKAQDHQKDQDYLVDCIKRQQILLSLSEEINNIFSLYILLNYVASSFIICLVGFQATSGASNIELIKYGLFLVASLQQILLICYFGNMLIVSSADVANGACENDWKQANQKCKKMLLFVIVRSQKASALRPLMLDDEVSLRSFSKVCNVAYQFFALLRTLYSQ